MEEEAASPGGSCCRNLNLLADIHLVQKIETNLRKGS